MTKVKTRDWFALKKQVIGSLVSGLITREKAQDLLGVKSRTVRKYLKVVKEEGLDGLKDKRRSNFVKVTPQSEAIIVKVKREGMHRSARFVRDKLDLKLHKQTVWRVFVKHGINRPTLPPIKPHVHFEASCPNQMWQADIMGKMIFPHLGVVFLVCVIDDHSRKILKGAWFKSQQAIYVYEVWYEAMCCYGMPEKMLQDRGTQFFSHHRKGEADYEYYARVLGIKLVFANYARTKGKLERRFRFIQHDFCLENMDVRSLEELNRKWEKWVKKFNQNFVVETTRKTPNQRYEPLSRRELPEGFEDIMMVQERRKVRTNATISLYGKIYRVPARYIRCWVWVKICGRKVILECGGKDITKFTLKS